MLNFLANGGAMAGAIREHDWSASPLGHPQDWPAVLKITVAAVISSRFPQCIVWGPEMITIPNDAFLPILGDKPPALGRPWNEVWSEVWDDIGPIAERAFAGEPTFIEDYGLTIERYGAPENAWFTFCYSPIRDVDGTIVGMLDTVVETTQTVLTRTQSHVIARELVHRIKNALTVVQSIAMISLRGETSVARARKRLMGRLDTLAKTHDVLLESDHNQASVDEIVRQALAAHVDAPERLTTDGPYVSLPGRQTLSLSLALHELATNATKYGALSVPQGRLQLCWRAGREGSDEEFVFEWREEGGPRVSPPNGTGFGSQLVTKVVPSDFGGSAEIAYEPEGVCYTLRAPMNRLPHYPDQRAA